MSLVNVVDQSPPPPPSLALLIFSIFFGRGGKGLAHCHRAICSGIHPEARENHAYELIKILAHFINHCLNPQTHSFLELPT